MCYIVAKKDIMLIHPDQSLCQLDIDPYFCTVNSLQEVISYKNNQTN
jgi:hypothetical protein